MLRSSLALGAFLLPQTGPAAQARRRARGVILVLLDGGMSHLESWDPKPAAPAEVRGEFGSISTTVPALRVCEHMPLLARQARLYNVIRSVHCDARNDHSPGLHVLLTGWENTTAGVAGERFNYHHPSQGSLIAHQLGVTSPAQVPRFVALPRRGQIGGQVGYGTPAFLGSAYDAWETGMPPASASLPMQLPPSLALSGDSIKRLDDRMALRDAVNRLSAALDHDPTTARLDPHYHTAYQVLAGQRLRHGLDLSQEPVALRERYGNTLIGQSLLLARRLVEAGVTYVLVNPQPTNAWDFHAKNFPGHKKLLPPMDRAVSALLTDLDQRGLLDEVLVLVSSEMGRTPKINKDAGRDHWTSAYSVLMAGGGLTRGQVLGRTSSQGERPVDRPVAVPDILTTIYRQLGIQPNVLLHDEQGRPVPILPDAHPIRELIA
jgi:hypothetical protein